MNDVTQILAAMDGGNADSDALLPLVYEELRRLARAHMDQERAGQTLQATALVHEAFIRLVGDSSPTWQNRRHFFGAAARAMQRILVEQARRKKRLKHGGEFQRAAISDMNIVADAISPKDDLLAIDDALEEFAAEEPQKAELVRLRYFAGMTEEEAALALDISRATAARWWAFAKASLFAKIRK